MLAETSLNLCHFGCQLNVSAVLHFKKVVFSREAAAAALDHRLSCSAAEVEDRLRFRTRRAAIGSISMDERFACSGADADSASRWRSPTAALESKRCSRI